MLSFTAFSQETGKVGINTDSPTETLDVNGTLKIRNVSNALAEDLALYIDKTGTIKKSPISTVRHVWGLIRFDSNNISIMNPGSGDWTVRHLSAGTALITINTPFSKIPAVSTMHYLHYEYKDVVSFPYASVIDNTGIDGVSLNKIQIWVSDSSPKRISDGRLVSFSALGF